jgi:hypothetical protein
MNRITLQKILGYGVLGVTAVIYAGFAMLSGEPTKVVTIGLFSGIAGGFVSALIEAIWKSDRTQFRAVRVLGLVLSPLGLFVLLPFSIQLAQSYFVGAAITFCLGSAIQALAPSMPKNGASGSSSAGIET